MLHLRAMSAKVDNFYAHCALLLLFTYVMGNFYALLLLFTYVMGNFYALLLLFTYLL